MQADVVVNLGWLSARSLGDGVDKRSHVRADGSAEALSDVVTRGPDDPDSKQGSRKRTS